MSHSSRTGRKERHAMLNLRFGHVISKGAALQQHLTVTVLDVCEVDCAVRLTSGHWALLTSHSIKKDPLHVDNLALAAWVIARLGGWTDIR